MVLPRLTLSPTFSSSNDFGSYIAQPCQSKGTSVAVPSTINIQVIFNPGTLQNQNLPLLEGALVAPPLPQGYQPPQMAQASYAVYPANSVGTGTVVLSLVINRFSLVKEVTPIRSVPSLTEAAIATVKNWTVNPAMLNEKRLKANVIVAFVFRSPNSSTP